MPNPPNLHPLQDRFRGALLGTLVGDALGMPWEGWSAERIRREVGEPREMIDARRGVGTFTDDTQMTGAFARALVEAPDRSVPELDRIARAFAEAYDPDRGYGGNTGRLLSLIRRGTEWGAAVEQMRLPGGSFANGSSMRVAPAALAGFPDLGVTVRLAEAQCRVTGHDHPEARFGARLQAAGILACLRRDGADNPPSPLRLLYDAATGWAEEVPPAYVARIEWIEAHADARLEDAVPVLKAGLQAAEAVPSALWSFLLSPHDGEEAIVTAVSMGSDTDTVGAMAGALAGAWNGASALPDRWLSVVEGGEEGREGLIELADRLFGLRGRDDFVTATGLGPSR